MFQWLREKSVTRSMKGRKKRREEKREREREREKGTRVLTKAGCTKQPRYTYTPFVCSRACELPAFLGPIRGKSNYSKRDRKLSQSRSNPSIYTARPGVGEDERIKKRQRIKEDGSWRDKSWDRSARGCAVCSLSPPFFSSVACWKHSLTTIRSFFLVGIFNLVLSLSLCFTFFLSLFLSFYSVAFLSACLNVVTAFAHTHARSLIVAIEDAWWMQRRRC